MNTTELQSLKARLHGRLILPADPDYDTARRVYNGMIDKRPAAIAQCADTADVVAVLAFARESETLLAVRGGGHHGAGLGVCDDGVVLDLSPMREVRVDDASREVRVAGGATWGEVDRATQPFGLAVPSGIISTTGVAGLTLGGGHGYLTRKYGLTIDNLIGAEVVLADGRVVTASASEHDDLFWALRGGGGNFGVVTSFRFRAQPVGEVYAGPTLWPVERAAEVLRWYDDFMRQAPDDVYGFFAFLNVPPAPFFPAELHGRTMCAVIWCVTGPIAAAERALEPARRLGPPAFTMLGAMPFGALQTMHDALMPPGLQWYWKGDFVRELNEQAIAEHVRYGSALPTALSTMHLYPIDGAANRVDRHATAFSFRDARWSMVMAGIDPDPAKAPQITRWAKDYWSALHPHSMGAAYVNFMMEEGTPRVRATYRDNFDRLAAIKAKYDPANLFRVNQNIEPLTGGSGSRSAAP
ncbi:MAG: FAD-binding oxidoreductase [Verrucomicrobiales bacterium]|nr:FAD-binding oxidoreductase [Verrucomicrobiales bacterium]